MPTAAPLLVAAAVVIAGSRWAARSSPPTVREMVRSEPAGRPALPRAVVVAVALAGLWAAGPIPVAAVGGLWVAGRRLAVRRARSRALARRDAVVPDLIDLFVIAAAAGHTAHGCIHAVAARAPEPVQPVMARAGRRLRDGEPVRVVLAGTGAELVPLGGPLIGALASGATTGAPMTGGLAQVAEAAREARRRAAEEQARRLPVTLLFPLVLCILPAFLLLAVVPLLVGSLGSLQP